MIAVASDAHGAHAAPPGGDSRTADTTALEVPARANVLRTAAEEAGARLAPPRDFGLEPILAVHETGLIEHLRDACGATRGDRPALVPDVFPHPRLTPSRPDAGAGVTAARAIAGSRCFDCSSPLYAGTWDAAYAAAQIALTAARALASERLAYALCRPPGHHAGAGLYGGFCYLNNAAIAAAELRCDGRVAMLDLDIHHGNGSQDVFWADPEVLTVSIHEHPSYGYPYFTGYEDERGERAGEGFNLNLTLPQGCEPPTYLRAVARALERVSDFGPAALVVALGFDGLAEDPLSDARLTPAAYGDVAALVAGLQVPTLLVQEGGYALEQLQVAARRFFEASSG